MSEVRPTPDNPDADDRLRDLLRTIDRDAAPVDHAALKSIRARLAAGSAVPAPDADGEVSASVTPVNSKPLASPQPRKRSMFVKLAALSAVIVTGATLWFGSLFGPGGVDSIALGDVLRSIDSATVLHLELIRGDDANEVWIQQGAVRRQQSPTKYEIIRGSRLWRIDEDENTVVSENSLLFEDTAQRIGFFDVVGLRVESDSLMDVASTGRMLFDGVDCNVFETEVAADDRRLALTWYADTETNRLRAIVAHDRGSRAAARPVMEVRLLAIDEPVDESLFVVSESLSEDGRIGKVLQAQGIVSLKPVMNARWTPLARQTLLRPGDWLRTDVRGANAALAAMTTHVHLTVGPASLVEFISPSEVRLHYGQVQIDSSGDSGEPFLLRGPGEAQVEITAEGKQIIRVAQDDTLATVAEPPNWLQGFEGTTSEESIGSLIVEVDGRNVPLTVGYHHVSVEIRDQIVRTTIEQSFVNHTDTRLEGIFHFPLPQDASISGFGMWIGNELVEADVVEKQRAREIYETILRERRDPGLLEWTGGNIFKARVFPIEPNSEKRIKIVYTQVLPLRGNRYRYSYALNSELLRTSPLRELSIDVLCYSDLPLKGVECPSHTVRSEMTAHSAHVEFSAQEYSPDRDFELVFELDERQSDVVVIPHRRGDDGYFLIQIMPPSADGNWQREVLPDGQPLNLLLLCDTSASMDSTKREQQREFVAAMLSSLSSDDRFRLAACDVETVWCIDDAVAATDESRTQVANFLDARMSLGWTDLDQAFGAVDAVVTDAAADTSWQVIYVGDGIVSAGDTDAAAFANRVQRLFADSPQTTFHAVSVGNSFESVALKGLAEIGSGSVRSIGGDMSPALVAFELLNEIAQPGLKNVNLEFRGLQTAAVYPETLPNVPAGTQQIIVGRYLPEAVDQEGEVVVTGTLNGEPVRYAARVSLPNEEAGNSFLPRLWARAHLDFLMAQGTSQFIRDQIIALSEEFHIITPYTSLLVLESDADRERFGIIRRYEMRDGEQFFAEGRDNATYELVQQQMRRAGDWRIGLRRQILAVLAGLGRSTDVFQPQQQYPGYGYDSYDTRLGRAGGGGWDMPLSGTEGPVNGPSAYTLLSTLGDLDRVRLNEASRESLERGALPARTLALSDDKVSDGPASSSGTSPFGEQEQRLRDMEERKEVWDGGRLEDLSAEMPFDELDAASLMAEGTFLRRGRQQHLAQTASEPYGGFGFGGRGYYQQPDYFGWIDQIFPALELAADPATSQPRQADWPDEVRAITDTLNHVAALQSIDGGVLLRSVVDSRDPAWDRDTGHSESIELYSPNRWLSRADGVGPARIIHWCDGEQRGVYSATLGLGRVRDSIESDWTSKRIGAGGFGNAPLHETLSYMKAALISNENGQAVIEFQYESPATQGFRYTIDTELHVVIKTETLDNGNVISTTTYANHVEVGGIWWPTRVVSTNEDGEVVSTTTQEVSSLTAEEFAQRMEAEFNGPAEIAAENDGYVKFVPRDQALFIELPMLDVEAAKLAVADGSADWNAHFAVMLHYLQTQQWDEVRARLASIDQLEAGKPGLIWLHAAMWRYTQSNADVLTLLTEQARLLVDHPRHDEWAIAEHIRSVAYPITSWPEYGVLLELMRPIYLRQPAQLNGEWHFDQQWLSVLQNRSLSEQALELERQLAEQAPWELNRQTSYARNLANSGRSEEAYAWLDAVLQREQLFVPHELQNVYNTYDNLMSTQGHYDRLVLKIEEWIERQPTEAGYDPYQRLLGSLVMDDQIDRAHELVRQWVAAGKIEGELPPEVKHRLDAAIYFMLGQAYHVNWHRIDPRWLSLLQETAEFHLQHPESFEVAHSIMNSGQFRDSDEFDAVQQASLDVILEETQTRDISQLQYMLYWLQWGQPGIEISFDDWQQIAGRIRTRWEGEEDTNRKYTLSEMLVSIYANHFSDTEYLPFLRLRIETADEAHLASYRSALFEALLARNWTLEIEEELFRLLPDLQTPAGQQPWEALSADDVPRQEALVTQLLAQLHALHRTVDRMIEARVQEDERVLQAEGHPEELTRQQLAAKQAEFRTAAQQGVLDRLSLMIATWSVVDEARPEGAPMTIILNTLTEWAEMEALYLQVVLSQNLDAVANRCWNFLGDEPPRIAEPPEDEDASVPELLSPIEWTQELLAEVRRHRALMTLLNLGARRSAEPALVDRLLTYLDAGISHQQSDQQLWKQLKYYYLIALDRPDELVAALTNWIEDEALTAPWRLALGKLYAERGQLEEAIRLYEAIENLDELQPAEYRLLSDWYQVVDRKDDYERTRVESLMVNEEWQLQQFVQQHVYEWQNAAGPRGNYVDDEVRFALEALFTKSGSPGNYCYLAGQLYLASGDFRVLEILPESVLGRTPQQVYPFLDSIRTTLNNVHREATADEMLATVARLREGDLTTIDLRALDLIEAMIERRASEVLNQPGPHIAAALAAMQRAFDREWGAGEQRQMADFLYQLGYISQSELNDERLRELRELAAMTDAATDDGFWITYRLCSVLCDYANNVAEGLQRFEVAIDAYAQAHPEGWPSHMNEPLQNYLSRLQDQLRFSTAENLITKFLETPLNDGQRFFLLEQLDELYLSALDQNGRVSIGEGVALYVNLRDRVIGKLETPDHNHRANLIYRLMRVYRIAHGKRMATVVADIQEFCFQKLPEVLERQTTGYGGLITNVAHALKDIVSTHTALRFLVLRVEQYPERYEFTWENAWSQHASRLAEWRAQVGDDALGPIEERLLALVLKEIRRDLLSREQRDRQIYSVNHTYYWGKYADEYRRIAEEVYDERRHSGRSVKYIAEYMYWGIPDHARGIEMLFTALDDGILDEVGQNTLITWLFENNRHGEAIPICQALVEKRPERIDYRTQLMRAYFYASRPQQLRELLATTDEYFRQPGKWTEYNVAALAHACVECQLDEAAIEYFDVAIKEHQRTQPNQGIGSGTLSYYYYDLAMAHIRLGHTSEAVDAASGAIVAWGADDSNRADALNRLNQVLTMAGDLDEYVATLDAQAETTGQDSAILRKAIGMVYRGRENFTEAARNLEIALELGQHDPEVYEQLLQCYDQLEQTEQAIELLLTRLEYERHNFPLYSELANRLAGDPAAAERAYTSIVEASPNEAENHEALARVREEQGDWSAAIEHWEQVAEFRSLEPKGLYGLIHAQIQAGRLTEARQSMQTLRETDWNPRFRDEVQSQLEQLRLELEMAM